MNQYDYIIVGAGSAGCVLANRLSANPDTRVLLIEAGPTDRYPWIHIPIGYAKTMFNKKYNWCFYTEPDNGMNGRRVYWPRGKVLGGSSAINGLIYIRGQHADYDHWENLGNTGWGWNDVMPYFIRAENNSRGASKYHGDSGPQAVSDVAEPHELAEAFINSCVATGMSCTKDFNGEQQEGAGYFQLITRHGRRCSSAVGYLKPVRYRNNLDVQTEALASRIILENSVARGIAYLKGGKEVIARADVEVILSAGAINSPHLLMLSGIGDPEELLRHGIEVQQANASVGKNMKDHLQIRLINECNTKITTNDDLKSWYRQLKMGMRYLLFRSGPLSIGINQAGAFTATGVDYKRPGEPDIQFHFAALSSDMPGSPLHDFSGFTSSVCQLRPESKGFIQLKSSDPRDIPEMHANYLSTDYDRRSVIEALKVARRVAGSAPLNRYIAREHAPGPDVTTDEDLLEFARNTGVTIFHPSCTCRMGIDDASVVDTRLRVRGVGGLRVVDCSIMPDIVSGNTHAPAVMIAEKASDMILEDNR
ncbi:MAG: choline dehydrogenase [marine bacterium B5-7]|nr:MAG: choline dehydrogenase [marine bacterium B5-7]